MAAPLSKWAETPQEHPSFWTLFFFLFLQEALVFPDSAQDAGCRATVARQPRVHTWGRTRVRQYGGAGPLYDLSKQRVSAVPVAARTAADPASDLDRGCEVVPGVEGELPEPTASQDHDLPRGLVAPRGVLWASGRQKPAPGLLRE